jgi:hypothetical protein
MPAYKDHLCQSARNLKFLESVNSLATQFYDWEVTTCYYVAVHLINAHLSLYTLQLRRHYDVTTVLKTRHNEASIPRYAYCAYAKLQALSRRSRYLVDEHNANRPSIKAFSILDIHLSSALKQLHVLMSFFKERYGVQFEKIKIKYPNINVDSLCYCEKR